MIDESGQSSGFGVVTQPEDTITPIKAGIAKNAHSNIDYWKALYETAEAELKRLREDNERLAKEAGYIGAALSAQVQDTPK